MSQYFQDPSTGKIYQEVSGPQGLVPFGGGGFMGAPAGVYPQQPFYPQQPQNDMSSALLGALLPAITTLPAVTNGTTVAANLQAKLKALAVPAASPGNPTQAEHNALLAYTNEVKLAVQEAVGNDATVFESVRKNVMLSILGPMLASGGAGGQNGMLAFVLLFAFGGF
jgi:hypothetical protein